MHNDLLITPSIIKNNNINLASNILNIIDEQKNNAPFLLETSEAFEKAKGRIIKQLPNMYKNTRLNKYCISNTPTPTTIEYKKIKGLVLNIQKRMCWYLGIKEENTKCLLISIKAKTSKEDLANDEIKKYFFEYYAKFFVFENGIRKFTPIPLVDLYINVI